MQAIRRAAVLLAILAMTLRGLMPAGWMPNPDGISQTAFVLCDMDDTGMSATDMAHMGMAHMDMSHMDMSRMAMPGGDPGTTHKHADDGHQQACPFSAAPHVATPSAAAMLFLPSMAVAFAHPLHVERPHIGGGQYTPQSPRAPPELA